MILTSFVYKKNDNKKIQDSLKSMSLSSFCPLSLVNLDQMECTCVRQDAFTARGVSGSEYETEFCIITLELHQKLKTKAECVQQIDPGTN